ncbi:hypothetical protein OLK001_17160 [Synechocystis sp. LKSZ1]
MKRQELSLPTKLAFRFGDGQITEILKAKVIAHQIYTGKSPSIEGSKRLGEGSFFLAIALQANDGTEQIWP